MKETDPVSGHEPHEVPFSGDDAKRPARRTLRWYHWLAFFSPAVVCVLSVRFGPAVEGIMGLTPDPLNDGLTEFFKWCMWGMGLGVLLCVVIGQWFARQDDGPDRQNGCLWTISGLIVNAGLAWGGCAFMGYP